MNFGVMYDIEFDDNGNSYIFGIIVRILSAFCSIFECWKKFRVFVVTEKRAHLSQSRKSKLLHWFLTLPDLLAFVFQSRFVWHPINVCILSFFNL
jgi:hypothetical protein